MHTFLIAAMLTVGGPESPQAAGKSDAPLAEQTSERPSLAAQRKARIRRAGALRQEVRQRLTAEATAAAAKHRATVEELVDLYVRLKRDNDLTEGEKLRLSTKVRSRLTRIAARLERGARHAPRGPTAATASPAEVALAATAEATAEVHAAVAQSVGIPATVLAQIAAGPAAGPLGPQGGLGGRGPGDYGDQLVDLIQTVIAPDTWDVVGGPGTIYYYRPLRVLVVRQTAEVHDELADLLGR